MGKSQKLIERLGVKKIRDILRDAHTGAVYFVDEWNDHFKVHGFYSDKCIVGVHNPHTHYKLVDLREAFKEAVNPLKVGQKVKFDQEKYFRWTVRAVRSQFAILTTAGEKGYYTIVDFVKEIRGPDNCYGVGYGTDEQVAKAMERLHEPHGLYGIEISGRHRIPLVIAGVKDA